MLEGIAGSNQVQPNNNKAAKSSNTTSFGVDFKNTFMELTRSANMAIAGKGNKEGIEFNKRRDLEDNLYFNPEEEEEDAALSQLKKLKKMLKEKLGS
ncbi:hypothetical protein ACFL31_00045 [Candidatus Margulisiibacteriota bacterium]